MIVLRTLVFYLMILYYHIVRKSDNCIIKSCYEDMVSSDDEWVVNIKNELRNLGLNYMFDSQISDTTMYAFF